MRREDRSFCIYVSFARSLYANHSHHCRLPHECTSQTQSLLLAAGVDTILGKRVIDIISSPKMSPEQTTLKLFDGTKLCTSHVISAIPKPVSTTCYLRQETLDSDGLIKVRPTLHFASSTPSFEHLLAIGDVTTWPGIKRCGPDLQMGNFAASNIHQHVLQSQGLVQRPDY